MGLERKEYDLRRTLVMFVAQVLHHGPERLYTNDSWPLPVGHPEIYYEDDVEALRQILPQGVLWGICKSAGGWEQRALLQGREAGVAKAHVQRFWEANAGLELRFGEGAVQLCEGLYNVVATRPPKGTDVPRRTMHTTTMSAGTAIICGNPCFHPSASVGLRGGLRPSSRLAKLVPEERSPNT